MTLKESSSIFIRSLYDIGLSGHTIISYKNDIKQFITKVGEDIELDNLTYPIISEFFFYLSSKSLAIATLKRKRTVIQRYLKFCYEKRLCTHNQSALIDPIRTKNNNKPKAVLSTNEISIILDYLNQKIDAYKDATSVKDLEKLYIALRNRLVIYILLYTGCRSTEAVSIKRDDISLSDNTIGIIAKGNKYNKVPIHENLKAILEEYLHLESSFAQINSLIGQSIYLFPSRKNKDTHIATRTLYDLMMGLSDILGRNIHAHLFRHTFASYSIASGVNIATLSSIISHSNPAITLSIYTHEIESRQKQEEMKKLQFEI